MIKFYFLNCDRNGNVSKNDNPYLQEILPVFQQNKIAMGMMPHPERAVEPCWGTRMGFLYLNRY